MSFIHKFLTEEDVEYYRTISKKSKKYLKQLIKSEPWFRKTIGLPDGDIDTLLEQCKKGNFSNYCRAGIWNYDYISVLNNDGNVLEFISMSTAFRFVNKWNQEDELYRYRIIIDRNNKIIWIGRYEDKQYFISYGEKIYELGYEHKNLILFPNISSGNEYFDDDNNENNDNLIRKYKDNITYYVDIEDVQKIVEEQKSGAYISLEKHFEKGFFKRGQKWNQAVGKFFGYKNISILSNIFVKNNLFCIEIENITHPLYGQILLDLDKLEIVK